MNSYFHSIADAFAEHVYTDRATFLCRKVFVLSGLKPVTNKFLSIYYDDGACFQIMNEEIIFHSPNVEEFTILRGLKSDKPVLRDMAESLDENKVFYDVGANIGLYTCSIGSLTDCEVYSFEPHPKNADKLKQNAERNDISFTLMEKAASDKEGTERISIEKDVTGEGQVNLTNSEEGTKIKSCRLDNLVNKEVIPSPDVIKIDVEGAELKVLKGMENIDKKELPEAIYCEIHPTVERYGATTDQVEQKLREMDYKLETLDKLFGNRRMVKAEKK
ncbi:FkbM family methyltransferase [Candidatus Nanohalobium constans]|uniref:FkbM family methyltransferase n=1 Tax=Candidatus Nanohalobium constans TaxID=2565781 RepID=A0A5Q0UGV2_9ARCH|nr:FkbM family methyltransferase [Candidatus Nanohalobium constans]QGA80893.1 FkbM family methyltransferase [Candidatus Nanohalobium constans]